MGRLIDGTWSTHDLGADARGRYQRRAAQCRGRITADGSSGFAAEPGRYHLYVSFACGWSQRVLIVRKLKRLESAISASFANPFMGDEGWTFDEGADSVNAIRTLPSLYVRHQSDYTGRASVPVLWDTKTQSIVSNESLDIIEDLDSAFDAFGDPQVRFFPEQHRAQIEAMNVANYQSVNNGVYRCGFARSQQAYEEAVTELFARLDEGKEYRNCFSAISFCPGSFSS